MISRATKKDLDQIMIIIKDIIEEMQEIKNYQWSEIYPTREIFSEDIKNNNLYVYKQNYKIKGFICIDSNQPNEYSSIKWKHRGDVLVIHRMAIDTNSRELGIGRALMKHAEKLAEENGVDVIRSDTYSSRSCLKTFS